MNWAWASSLDQIWRSPAFPMWMTLAAAGFFGLILLITLLRAEKSVANGALTVITLLAIAIAVAATVRVYGPPGQVAPSEARAQAAVTASLPALSCLDDLAGDAVAIGCEKVLFGAPDTAAAAIVYTAARIDRLTALGDAATAEKSLTPDMKVLRKSLEHDRYGLVAQVLVARDGCTQFDCAAFRSLTDQQQVAANMDAHLYDQLVARYAPGWNAPAAAPRGGHADAGRACRAAARDADGQADQCRLPERLVDAAGEHHESGAAHGGDAPGGACCQRSRSARAGRDLGAGLSSCGSAGRSKEAAGRETCAGCRTGSARTAAGLGSRGCG